MRPLLLPLTSPYLVLAPRRSHLRTTACVPLRLIYTSTAPPAAALSSSAPPRPRPRPRRPPRRRRARKKGRRGHKEARERIFGGDASGSDRQGIMGRRAAWCTTRAAPRILVLGPRRRSMQVWMWIRRRRASAHPDDHHPGADVSLQWKGASILPSLIPLML